MPQTAHGAPYPSPLDARNVPAHLQALAEWADDHATLSALDAADRDARFAELSPGSLVTTSQAPWSVWMKTGPGPSWLTLYSDTGRITAGFSPGSGFAVGAYCEGSILNGQAEIRAEFIRTGDDIVAPSNGNISDVALFTPPPQFGVSKYVIDTFKSSASDGALMGMPNAGPFYMTSMNSGSTIASDQYVRVMIRYQMGV